jgi:hypothetical protein
MVSLGRAVFLVGGRPFFLIREFFTLPFQFFLRRYERVSEPVGIAYGP